MNTHCLDRNRLRDYLQGHLSDEESGPIIEHLEGCARCEGLATELESDSDWLLNHLSVAGMQPGNDQADPSWIPQVREALVESGAAAKSGPAADRSETPLPAELGAYEIQEVIGRGGMGIVYRAEHVRLGKTVALKVVAGCAAAGAGSRFEREMRAVGTLDHPAIVQATDADNAAGRAFLVMELVDGIDLRTLTRRLGPLSPADACEIVRQAAVGLQAAHEAGVIHRDVKPSNLMLNRQGRTKILDFGLAQLREDLSAASLSTSLGRVIGTLDYLAPEQTDGSRVDARADVYGLGATLFSLLAGRPAFGRSSEVPLLSHLRRVATEDAPRLSEFRRDVPDELTELLAEMLAREPQRRVQTAGEVAERLAPLCTESSPAALAEKAIAAGASPATNEERQQEVAESLAEFGLGSAARSGTTAALSPGKPPRSTGCFLGAASIGLLLLVTLALGGWLGMTILLNTGEGQLRIESQAENVQVQLLREGKAAATVQVEQDSETVTLRAGRYRIRIEEPADGIRISQQQIRVLRGEEVVVTVTQELGKRVSGGVSKLTVDEAGVPGIEVDIVEGSARETSRPSRLSSGGLPDGMLGGVNAGEEIVRLPSTEPTLGQRLAELKQTPVWDGKRSHEWLEVLETERQPQRRADAITAIVGLAGDLPPQLGAALLLRAGAATVEAFVGNDPDKIAAIVAAEPSLWEDDLGFAPVIPSHLRRLHHDSAPQVGKKCGEVVDALASLPIDMVILAFREAAPDAGLAEGTILIRSMLRRGLTRAERHDARYFDGAGFSGSLWSLVLSTFDEQADRFQYLFTGGGPDRNFGTNAAEAALALRLVRIIPNDIAPDSRLRVFARAIAYNQFDLAGPLYHSRRVRPVEPTPMESDYLAGIIIPVLKAKLDRPGFIDYLLESDFGPLDALVEQYYQSPLDNEQVERILERVLTRLAEWRDAAQLTEQLPGNAPWAQYYKIGGRFAQIAELLTCLNGRLPDLLTKEVEGSGDLPAKYRAWKAGEPRRAFQRTLVAQRGWSFNLLHVLARWYPYQMARYEYLESEERAPLNLNIPPALWLASIESVVGKSRMAEARIIRALQGPPQEGPLRDTIRGVLRPSDVSKGLGTVLRRHLGAGRRLVDRVVESAESDLLKAHVLLAYRYPRPHLVAPLIKSDSPEVAMQAILWMQALGKWPTDGWSAAFEQLTKPGFAELGHLVHRSVKERLRPYLFQRMVLLNRLNFNDRALKPIAQELARAYQRWVNEGGLPAGRDHAIRHALVAADDRLISAHPFTPAMRLINRFPALVRSMRDELVRGYAVLEKARAFEGNTGQELRQVMDKAIEIAQQEEPDEDDDQSTGFEALGGGAADDNDGA